LAANANDPSISALVVELLNEFQPKVDACHNSQVGIELKRKLEEQQKVRDVTKATRMKEMQQQRRMDTTAKAASKEVTKLAIVPAILPNKRMRKVVERFTDVAYHPTKGYKLSGDDLQAALQPPCETCYQPFAKEIECGECSKCHARSHFKCHGVPFTQAPFACKICSDKMKSTSRAKHTAAESDSTSESGFDEASVIEDSDGGASGTDENSEEDYARSDDESSDEEDVRQETSSNTARRLREDLIEARDELSFLRTAELEEFINEEQPDDVTRHQLALLMIPFEKIWTLDDLKEERNMRLGLHLLWNKINAKTELHFGKSIHIRYNAFPKDIAISMERNVKPSMPQIKQAYKGIA